MRGSHPIPSTGLFLMPVGSALPNCAQAAGSSSAPTKPGYSGAANHLSTSADVRSKHWRIDEFSSSARQTKRKR